VRPTASCGGCQTSPAGEFCRGAAGAASGLLCLQRVPRGQIGLTISSGRRGVPQDVVDRSGVLELERHFRAFWMIRF